MKIALLSGASSIHTIRWANGLAEAGHEVHVISQQAQLEPMDSRVQVHCFPFRGILGYFTMVPAVKKLLAKIKPDSVNAHSASGSGTPARLGTEAGAKSSAAAGCAGTLESGLLHAAPAGAFGCFVVVGFCCRA